MNCVKMAGELNSSTDSGAVFSITFSLFSTSGLKMSTFENNLRTLVEHHMDELQMVSYDTGWNAVIDELNRCIAIKEQEQDTIAVAVLIWARDRISTLEGNNDV